MSKDGGPRVILAAEHVSKRFQATQAVDDVSLALAAGEVHGIVGQNGAGKSTLIKLLSGVLQPDRGRLLIRGAERRLATPRAAMGEGIVVIPQELRLVPALTVAENVMLGQWPVRLVLGMLRVLDRGRTRETAGAALERLGMAVDLDTPVGLLPYAERQLVAIARALAHRASLLILDEPTAALERAEVLRLFEIVGALRAAGVAIVYISHRLDEVVGLADRCTVLRDGRVAHAAARGDFDVERLVTAMTGRDPDALPASTREGGRQRALGATLLEAEVPGSRVGPLHVHEGEIVGLAGLLGSGATVLLRRLFGAGDGSSVRVRGTLRVLRSPASAIAARIGMVPAERARSLVPDLSVLDNVLLPSLRRLRGEAADAVVTGLMEVLDIRPRGIHVPVRSLSGGNQQKVIFARWLAAQIEVLLLDEPTQGIDVAAKAAIHRLMGEFAERGGGILAASAELEELLGTSDRLLAMRAGTLVAAVEGGTKGVVGELRRVLGG